LTLKNATTFTDRLQEQAKAKKAALEKFKAAAEDPEVAAVRAERAQKSKAREERRALAEAIRKERVEGERRARDAEKKKLAEAREEQRMIEQAAADLARAEAHARARVMLARQKAALERKQQRA
jgi:colicin import membrane protein